MYKKCLFLQPFTHNILTRKCSNTCAQHHTWRMPELCSMYSKAGARLHGLGGFTSWPVDGGEAAASG